MARLAKAEAAAWQHAPVWVLGPMALAFGSTFSGAKTLTWALLGGALTVLWARRTEAFTLGAGAGFALLNTAAWALAALTGDAARPDAVLLQGLAALTWLVLAFHPPRAPSVERATTFAGGAVALVAVLQWLGADPLAVFAPERFEAARMRVYGTLGNPDFVAAFVTPCFVLALARKRWPFVALMALALCATRSWATVLALFAAAAVLKRPLLLLAAAAVAAATFGRGLGPVVQGRFELWAQAWPHLGPLGHGPGAALALTAVDHVHSDLLERWLEGGALGLFALAAPLLWALRRRTATAAALAAFAARLVVDFPLARPAELCLFVFLITTEEDVAPPAGATRLENLK